MKIGIDASRAFLNKKTGTEKYSYELIKGLTMMDTSCHQIFLYAKKGDVININLPKNFVVQQIKNRRLWTQLGLSMKAKKNQLDALFIPSHSVPFIHPLKTIATIHGLEYKNCPDRYPIKERVFLELNTFLSAKWSEKIIVPSESTKKDLIKFYKVNPEKIHVVYHGVESIQYPVSSIQYNKQGFNILFIGRLEKRKNLVNLIKAFTIFMGDTKSDYKLILAGKKGFGFEEIEKAIETSSHKKDIILKGYVSENEKVNLYKNADIFILPSFYEGFGLPILEAMKYQVPVICSNVSSLPEVAGNAAMFVNPKNAYEIAEAIKKIASNENLKNDMIKKGLENVKRFSWKKCAEETLKVLTG